MLRIDGNDKKYRIEDAIYYRDGRVALLRGKPTVGYKVHEWTTFDELEKNEPDWWGDIYEMHKVNDDNYIVYAGETSYGGAGFVSLYDKNKKEYRWVLHLNECNNFKSISVENGVVIAISDYSFPNGTEFKLPVETPELIEVTEL